MLNGRKSLVTLIATAAITATVGMIPSGSAQAKPTITDVQNQVDRLYRAAEQASEHYNQVHVQLKQMRGAVHALRQDQARQQHRTEQARQLVASSIVSQYEGDSLSDVGQAVVSSDPTAFISKLTTMSAFNSMQANQYTSYLTQAKALSIRQDATSAQLAKVADLEQQAAKDKATIQDNLDTAEGLLSSMKAAQQKRLLEASRSNEASRSSTARTPSTATITNVPASGRAAVAVRFALAQVGKAYVYGAAGPSAYDCSGLTMRAWGAAGVALSHSSGVQWNEGTHVSPSQLQPGDLVFYYNPSQHVDMYIGNGMVVGAQNPSDGIRVVPLYSMPFVGAVRPG